MSKSASSPVAACHFKDLSTNTEEAAQSKEGADRDFLHRFYLRYECAIEKYVHGILNNMDGPATKRQQLAEEICDNIESQMTTNGSGSWSSERGPFRPFLKGWLRNCAKKHVWKEGSGFQFPNIELLKIQPSPGPKPHEECVNHEEQECLPLEDATWREFILRQTWERLQEPHDSILRFKKENSDLSEVEMADKRNMTYEAWRQALSRARREFARCLRDQVKSSLGLPNPTDDEVDQELVALRLLDFARPLRTKKRKI